MVFSRGSVCGTGASGTGCCAGVCCCGADVCPAFAANPATEPIASASIQIFCLSNRIQNPLSSKREARHRTSLRLPAQAPDCSDS
jgi:hypothetical protein